MSYTTNRLDVRRQNVLGASCARGSAGQRRTIPETQCRESGRYRCAAQPAAGGLISLAACHTAVLTPAGPVGEGNRIILLDSLTIMLAIVVPTIVAILAFAYWFRASNTRARYLPEWAYSGRLELIVWSIPALW